MQDADAAEARLRSRYRPIIATSGLAITGLAIYLSTLGDLTERIPTFIIIFGAMFVLYAVSSFLLSRLHEPYRPTLILIFVVAVLCRVVNLGTTPSLSNDVYRYLWEGRVIQAGANPFATPPDASELEGLRDANYDHVNHKHLETIYPPLAQAVFYLGAAIKADVKIQKVLFVLFDLATMVVILLLLRWQGRNLNLCAAWGWNPLVIVEFSHSGHMDSLGIFLLMLAVLMLRHDRRAIGVVALALSFLAKYLSVVLIPFLAFKKRYVVWLPLFVAVVVAGYLPFAGASDKLVSSLRLYGTHWEFNSLVFAVARAFFDDTFAIRVALAAILALFSLYQGYRRKDIMRYSYYVIGCALLLSPTVYPWYLCWIVPFLCFHSSRAWLYLSGAVVLSYWVWVTYPATGVWGVGWKILLIQYGPFLAILLLEVLRNRTRDKSVVT